MEVRAEDMSPFLLHELIAGVAPQGYQSTSPHAQSQWAPPAQNPAPSQQQWNQPQQPQGNWGVQQQQPAGGYNPGTYGVMPGGYGQAQPVRCLRTEHVLGV